MDISLVKSWARSRGVWGGIISAVGGGMALTGHALQPDDAQALLNGVMGIVQAVGAIAAAVGGIMSIVGRVRATHRIGPSTS